MAVKPLAGAEPAHPPARVSAPLRAEFEALAARLRAAHPQDDHELLRRAFEFAAQSHARQRRRSGEAFIAHPLAVASVLAEMRMDAACIAAGLLHDAVEDTPATIGQIRREFGPRVAHLVEGVTKIDRLTLGSQDARQAESVRKMLLAMVDDVRVILIKLADRLHNMRTLRHMPEEQQRHIAQETLEIYAPLAHRLGMGKMRGELEDLAFSYLEPSAYARLQAAVETRRAGGEEFLAGVQQQILTALAEHGVAARVEGRIKRLYSIWRKLERQRIDVDRVYDLLAVRIIVDSLKDCYAALGVVHSVWQPVPGRIKDFIATPRPNMYRSLHTSVIAESGQPFEVQIRTAEMHRMAEEGIAAHWNYKDGAGAPAADDERLRWLRRLVEWQQEVADPAEFLATLKVDLAPEEVYAFTPKGRILTLGREATVVDFAFAIHTAVGEQCVGAKVNGRIVPLRYQIRTGDIVEILTQPGHHPNRDWLSFVKTSRARHKIRHWLNHVERQRAHEIGRRALERDARRFEIALKQIREADWQRVAASYGLGQVDELYAAVGYGKLSARQVLGKLVPPPARTPEQQRLFRQGSSPRAATARPSSPILVRGFNDLLVYRAACCAPLHGEPIVGYITRGKGVAVHAQLCPNVQKLLYESDRRIDVEWAETPGGTQAVRLAIQAEDSSGMLNAITGVISERGANIGRVGVRTDRGQATLELELEVPDARTLEQIVLGLKRIAGVHAVERVVRSRGARARPPAPPPNV